MQGRRIYPDAEDHGAMKFAEGDYGKTIHGEWLAFPPGAYLKSLKHHEVVEHADGTITVSPSIEWPDFHGFLEGGVWRNCYP
ncbi:MAG: hypothetical protein U0990_04045 [Candidatus Nanopelagicales bacterium]|nr:hypothetical protein [Hyphomicrobiales bacterium]MDZ4249244.1 hypothetical protein [Candidatus Nanopelagicales bacterium]